MAECVEYKSINGNYYIGEYSYTDTAGHRNYKGCTCYTLNYNGGSSYGFGYNDRNGQHQWYTCASKQPTALDRSYGNWPIIRLL